MISAAVLSLALLAQTDALPRRGTLGTSFAPLPPAEAQKLGLKAGQGLIARKPLPNLTADKAGMKEGDVVVEVNGQPAIAQGFSARVRDFANGKPVTFKVQRDGKPLDLTANLTEKPRDPGNENFEVIYTHVNSNGLKIRTIISRPRKPGKYPALLFIQGFSPLSYDYNLEGPNDVQRMAAPILFGFANSGYVTMRVEKMGVGDSEGGPFADVDYTTELDIYRQGLKQLKEQSYVDAENVFIFGHSMGGAFAPMIAVENPVRGIAVYATAARTWREYFHDTLRIQGLLGGATHSQVDEQVRQGSRIMDLIFQEGLSADEVKKKDPSLTAMVNALFPDGRFNQKTSKFWGQLEDTNFAAYWEKVNCQVLALRGSSDFVAYTADHQLIADICNRVKPGSGEFKLMKNLDHLFNSWPSEKDALINYTKGDFDPAITNTLLEWANKNRK